MTAIRFDELCISPSYSPSISPSAGQLKADFSDDPQIRGKIIKIIKFYFGELSLCWTSTRFYGMEHLLFSIVPSATVSARKSCIACQFPVLLHKFISVRCIKPKLSSDLCIFLSFLAPTYFSAKLRRGQNWEENCKMGKISEQTPASH